MVFREGDEVIIDNITELENSYGLSSSMKEMYTSGGVYKVTHSECDQVLVKEADGFSWTFYPHNLMHANERNLHEQETEWV